MLPIYMLRHSPIITSGIVFVPAPPAPLPILTPRTAFTPERLKRQRVPEEDLDTETAKRQRLNNPPAHSSALQDEDTNLHAEKRNRNDNEKENDEESDKENDTDRENADDEVDTSGPPLVQGPKNMISKPGGEPGRRYPGGYRVEEVLVNKHQWSQAAVEELQKVVRTMAGESLNLTVSFSKQDKKKIQAICDQVQERWPDLARYEGCWPVRSILKLALKYRSEYSRRTHDKGVAERVRSAALGS